GCRHSQDATCQQRFPRRSVRAAMILQLCLVASAASALASSENCDAGASCAASMDATSEGPSMALLQTANQRLNASRANVSKPNVAAIESSKESKACVKLTGGTCLISGICDDSRSAECDRTQGSFTYGQCVCPQFTCASEGKCSWSAAEIRDAVGSGADNVVEKVTSTAANIPGLADTAGAIQGVWNTLGGVVGSILGANGGCSGYVGLCWGQCSNQQQLGYTASCQWGSCQCKAGFCANNGICQMDLSGMLKGAAGNALR
ncbi:unnamed protein product, partial [Cladocopium goreaui]